MRMATFGLGVVNIKVMLITGITGQDG